jgi:hypothetical protein
MTDLHPCVDGISSLCYPCSTTRRGLQLVASLNADTRSKAAAEITQFLAPSKLVAREGLGPVNKYLAYPDGCLLSTIRSHMMDGKVGLRVLVLTGGYMGILDPVCLSDVVPPC